MGEGFQFLAADSSFYLQLNTRFQSLYEGAYSYEDDTYSDQMMIRRARFKMEGFAYSPSLEYKIELALSNRDIGGSTQPEFNNTANIVLDAVVKWEFAPNFALWFGQTKLPGNRERVISSQRLQFVDRSLLNSDFNIDRDAGVQLHHTFSAGKVVFREAFAVSLGEGRNYTVTNRGGYDYTGRVEVLPFGEFTAGGDYFASDLAREKTPKLSVGVSYDYNDRASRQGGQLGSFVDTQRTLKALFVDAMFKYQGFSMMAEYADKETVGSPVVETDGQGRVVRTFRTGSGINLQGGYLFSNNYEIAGRYTYIDAEALTQREDLKQYTLGLSKYIAGHTVKFQTDVSLLRVNAENNELMYRFQVEMGF
ncbi:phosphate-selective porin O and P [Flammeovirgaceae bacterium 311]|nr:phosphate-selective porin O and P [Flammeovirgaceae bacterium 311]